MTDRETATVAPSPLRVLPGGRNPSQEETMVAILILAGLLALWGIRRGIRGIGPIELVGSAVSGVEFAAYLVVVGGMIRTAQATWPENPLVRATAFVY